MLYAGDTQQARTGMVSCPIGLPSPTGATGNTTAGTQQMSCIEEWCTNGPVIIMSQGECCSRAIWGETGGETGCMTVCGGVREPSPDDNPPLL